MDNEAKEALAKAKNDPTKEKIAKAEEKICQNGADNKLKDFVVQTSNKIKKGNLTKEEKAKLVREILSIITTEK